MKKLLMQLITIGLIVSAAQSMKGQGNFADLDFESPVLPFVPDIEFQVPVANAVPGWSVYVGGASVNSCNYNATTLDAAGVNLFSSGSGNSTIQGGYSVFLQSATIGVPAGSPTSAAIGQAGTIPGGTQTLLFAAGFGVPQVTFAGQAISTTAVGTYAGYTLYGGNISMFAGQAGQLLFSVDRAGNGNRQQVLLDAISFSSTPIPEPSAITLAALGLIVLGFNRRPKPNGS
jgi:hypothetical protein